MAETQLLERSAQSETFMTIEQFLAWEEEDARAEWVDGKVIFMSPVSRKHQEISRFLTHLIGLFVETRQLGTLLTAPYAMRLDHRPSAREPDLLFVRTQNFNRLKNTYLDGPADLVVEIISPESIGRDRGEKFAEYEQAGIPEYWLIDPIREQAEFYVLENARYRLSPVSNGQFQSPTLPGFSLHPDWFWMDPLPGVVTILKGLGAFE